MPTQDPRAWRVAIALGLESGLDWARWAAGFTAVLCPACDGLFAPCDRCDGSSYVEIEDERELGFDAEPRPVRAPWDADAYRADCERRGVEPGLMPSLEYVPAEGYGWRVVVMSTQTRRPSTWIRVEFLWCGRLLCRWSNDSLSFVDDGFCHRAHAVVFVAQATAAAKAMTQP